MPRGWWEQRKDPGCFVKGHMLFIVFCLEFFSAGGVLFKEDPQTCAWRLKIPQCWEASCCWYVCCCPIASWTHEQLKNIWWNMIWLSLHEFSSPTLTPCHFFMWGPVLCKNTVVYFALMSHDITWPYFMSYNVIHVWFEIHSENSCIASFWWLHQTNTIHSFSYFLPSNISRHHHMSWLTMACHTTSLMAGLSYSEQVAGRLGMWFFAAFYAWEINGRWWLLWSLPI